MSMPVIDVFLLFDPGDRNTYSTKEGKVWKVRLLPGPDWKTLTKQAKKHGFTLNVHGPMSKVDSATISTSFQSSDLTVIVGHGGGSMEGTKWVSNQIKLTDGVIIAPDDRTPGGLHVGQWEGGTLKPLPSSPAPARPDINDVTALFTCNSHDRMRDMFNIPAGSSLVTNDGGSDGLTRVGTLEHAAAAFVGKYMSTKGDVKKAVAHAQGVFSEAGKAYSKDKGDKIHVGP